jgi:hypothetical protein
LIFFKAADFDNPAISASEADKGPKDDTDDCGILW